MIINKINSGEVFDIYSYIKVFGYLKEFRIEKDEIEEKFRASEKGKKYKVLKLGVSPVEVLYYNNSPHITNRNINECDFEYKTATLEFDKLQSTIEYRDNKYTYDPTEGIEMCNMFNNIKEFICIWAYLCKELLVLEVSKPIDYKEIGLFFKIVKKGETKKEFAKKGLLVKLLSEREYEPVTNSEKIINSDMKANFNLLDISIRNEPLTVDANEFVERVLEFNYDDFKICDYYMDKKILPMPELDLYIKRHFRTNEQVNFIKALIPTYLAIAVTVLLPLIQKQDNTEIIKIQNQLMKVQTELSEIENTNTYLQELIDKIDKININTYNDADLKRILSELKKDIVNLK